MTKQTRPAVECRALPNGQAEMTITTEARDRMRGRVIQSGLTFPETVPVLFGHDAHSLPVGVSGRASMIRGAQQTRARWRWITGDARADAVRNAFEQGALAASVGMLVHASTPNEYGGDDITAAEVVEFSLVTIPANAECVRLLKSLGWSARGDDEETGLTPRDVLEAIQVIIPQLVSAQVAQHRGRLDVVDLGEIDAHDFDPVRSETDRALLVAAIRETVPRLLRRELDRLRGRISDD